MPDKSYTIQWLNNTDIMRDDIFWQIKYLYHTLNAQNRMLLIQNWNLLNSFVLSIPVEIRNKMPDPVRFVWAIMNRIGFGEDIRIAAEIRNILGSFTTKIGFEIVNDIGQQVRYSVGLKNNITEQLLWSHKIVNNIQPYNTVMVTWRLRNNIVGSSGTTTMYNWT